jgi:hypothetical protein
MPFELNAKNLGEKAKNMFKSSMGKGPSRPVAALNPYQGIVKPLNQKPVVPPLLDQKHVQPFGHVKLRGPDNNVKQFKDEFGNWRYDTDYSRRSNRAPSVLVPFNLHF